MIVCYICQAAALLDAATLAFLGAHTCPDCSAEVLYHREGAVERFKAAQNDKQEWNRGL